MVDIQLANSLEQHQGETAPEIGLEVIETSGSQENLKLLISGEVDFAMVQNHRAGSIKVRSITGLYDETLHLVAHKGSNIRTLTDLIGKKVSIGESNSGTAIVTRALLEFTLNDLNQIEETQPEESRGSILRSSQKARCSIESIWEPHRSRSPDRSDSECRESGGGRVNQ